MTPVRKISVNQSLYTSKISIRAKSTVKKSLSAFKQPLRIVQHRPPFSSASKVFGRLSAMNSTSKKLPSHSIGIRRISFDNQAKKYECDFLFRHLFYLTSFRLQTQSCSKPIPNEGKRNNVRTWINQREFFECIIVKCNRSWANHTEAAQYESRSTQSHRIVPKVGGDSVCG